MNEDKTTIENLLDEVHGKIMRECPKDKNPHRAVRLYVAQFIYARRRKLNPIQADTEAWDRVQAYYQGEKK